MLKLNPSWYIYCLYFVGANIHYSMTCFTIPIQVVKLLVDFSFIRLQDICIIIDKLMTKYYFTYPIVLMKIGHFYLFPQIYANFLKKNIVWFNKGVKL